MMRQREFDFGQPQPASIPPIEPWLELGRRLLSGSGHAAAASELQVRWNPRMRSSAGRAFTAKRLIELNPKLAAFGEGEIEATFRHELAHLLAVLRAGGRRIAAHGQEWREACRDLGIPGEKACHQLPLPKRDVARRHRYRCPGCGTEYRRVKPFRSAVACMACCRKHHRGKYHDRFRLVKIRA